MNSSSSNHFICNKSLTNYMHVRLSHLSTRLMQISSSIGGTAALKFHPFRIPLAGLSFVVINITYL